MNTDDVATLLLTFAALGFCAGWLVRARISALDVLDAQIKAERERYRAMFGEDEPVIPIRGAFHSTRPPTGQPPMASQPPSTRRA